jgi:hypothetical protein
MFTRLIKFLKSLFNKKKLKIRKDSKDPFLYK